MLFAFPPFFTVLGETVGIPPHLFLTKYTRLRHILPTFLFFFFLCKFVMVSGYFVSKNTTTTSSFYPLFLSLTVPTYSFPKPLPSTILRGSITPRSVSSCVSTAFCTINFTFFTLCQQGFVL